jgi:hypothetical protein
MVGRWLARKLSVVAEACEEANLNSYDFQAGGYMEIKYK